MSDNNITDTTQTSTATQTSTSSPTTTQPPYTPSNTDKDKEIADLRAENAAHRIGKQDAKALADKLTKDLAAAQAETDRRIKEAENPLKTKLEKQNERIKQSELKSAAISAGLRDLDLLPLIKSDTITIDDDGNVSGIEDAIKAFKESKPMYFSDAANAGDKGDDSKAKPPSTGSKKAAPSADTKTPPASVHKLEKKDYEAAKRAAVAKLRA